MPKINALLRSWLACTLLMLGFFFPQHLLAKANTDPNQGGVYEGVKQTCQDIREQIAQEDNDEVWLVEYIVTCVKAVIVGDDHYGVQGVFEEFIQQFYPAVEPAIKAAITLAVVLFGALLLAGMIEKTSRDSFVFLFKLAAIMYFVQTATVQWVFESAIGALDNLTEIVFTFGKGPEMDGRCRIQEDDVIWDRVDCMLDVLIGIRKEVPADNQGNGAITLQNKNEVSPDQVGIKRGLLYFFFTNITSSGIGAVIGFLGLYTVFTFTFAVIKSIHTYLAAVLGLAFILIFMPMFMPMLFFKATRNYFDKWYRIATSFVLQPVILFGFLSLMLIAFDTVLVSGDSSLLNKVTNDQADQMIPNDVLENSDVFENKEFGVQGRDINRPEDTASRASARLTGVVEGAPATPLNQSLRDGQLADGMNKKYAPLPGVNYERLAQVMQAGDDAEAKNQLTYSAIILALTSFVFISVLNYIPTLATDLAGGVFEVPNLYQHVGQNFLGSNQAEMMAAKASHVIRQRNPVADTVTQFRNAVTGRGAP